MTCGFGRVTDVSDNGVDRRIERLVVKNSRLKLQAVERDAQLNFDLGFDSHALLGLLLDIEDEFGFEVPPDQVPDYVGITMGELVERVTAHESARKD